MIKCPLCQSKRIKLTDIENEEENCHIRLFCPKCKKGMTITGILVYTVKEVNK